MEQVQYDGEISVTIKVRNAMSTLTSQPLEDEVREQLSERLGPKFNRGTVELKFNNVQITNERQSTVEQRNTRAQGASR